MGKYLADSHSCCILNPSTHSCLGYTSPCSSPPMTKNSRPYLLDMKILCHETLDQIYPDVSGKTFLELHCSVRLWSLLIFISFTDCNAFPHLFCPLWLPFFFSVTCVSQYINIHIQSYFGICFSDYLN